MLELAKHSWEGVVLGGSWVCHVAYIDQINYNNWRWWMSLSPSATMTCMNTSASKKSAYR